MTTDRFVHLVVGLIIVSFIVYKYRENIDKYEVLLIYLACALGTWVPDWDLVLGIGFHRSPITHGVIPCLVTYFIVRKCDLSKGISIGLAIGVASHLLWDIIDYGDVRWISGGNNDRMYLFVSAAALLVYALIHIVLGYTDQALVEEEGV